MRETGGSLSLREAVPGMKMRAVAERQGERLRERVGERRERERERGRDI